MKKKWILIVTTFLTVGVVLAVVSLIRAGPSTGPDLQAGAPTVVSYQGKVTVDDSPYDGTGYFKFAVVDAAGATTYWSNDGTSTGGGKPTAAVPLDVNNGLFTVLLGDTDLSGMSAPLTPAAFAGPDRYLRVWFSETGVVDTFTQLSPDRRIAAAPYALQAEAAKNAADADTVDGQHASAFVPRLGEAYVVVEVTADPATNGDNLLNAYAEAAALTPHGQLLSTTNRAVVLLPPGQYDLGTDPLVLDAEYVDLEGLSEDREKQHIYGTPPMTNTGVISQSANDVHLINLFVEITRASGGVNTDASDPAAYFPEGDETATVIRNCHFKAADEGHAWSMRIRIAYPGTYEQVRGYTYAFGGRYGTASGTFIDCTGGDRAFAGDHGTASGTFTNCVGGLDAFGGWGGTASGTFTNCTGGESAFGGGSGSASGTFNNCTGGDHAFGGGWQGTANGTFTHCTGGYRAFAGSSGESNGGVFRYCTGGMGSFPNYGTPEPVLLYCIEDGTEYTP
jgi:hypothetical protein